MIKELDDFNWPEAFKVSTIEAVLPWRGTVSLEGVDIEAVEQVVRMDEGENEGPDWVAVFRLKDGRYITLEAGCDYTGWNCQSSGTICVSGDLVDALRYGLTEQARDRLGVEVDAAGVRLVAVPE